MSARSLTDERWSWATVSPAEAAEMLGMPYESVLDAIARGQIPATRLGSRRIFVQVQALRRSLAIDEAVG